MLPRLLNVTTVYLLADDEHACERESHTLSEDVPIGLADCVLNSRQAQPVFPGLLRTKQIMFLPVLSSCSLLK